MLRLPRLAHAGYFAVKRRVDQFDHWPIWQQVRRSVQAPVYRFSDTGMLGLTRLQTHIVICGFPSAGTTLMQLMLENALPSARRFGRERSGWRAATYSLRSHAVMISKQPRDLFRLDPLREFYASRSSALKIILMLRDPRDLLTARRSHGDFLQYCGCPKLWKSYYSHFLKEQQMPDVLVIRYEDLVRDASLQQLKVAAFIGQHFQIGFSDFSKVQRDDFDASTLCGLRPLESSGVARWRHPIHKPRLNQMLRDLPELPAFVQQLNYETDHEWAADYL